MAVGEASAGGPDASVPPRPFLTAFAAGAAVLLASLAAFLAYHGYPAWRFEVAVVAVALAAAAAVAALVYAASQRLGRALLEGFLLFIAVDLNTDLLWLAALLGIALFIVIWRLRISALPALTLLATVVLLTTLAGLGERRPAVARESGPPAPAASTAPAILHLILDEHAGLEGIADPALRRDMAAFYSGRGFRLYGRAYSRHFHTVNAIPDVLNFGRPGASEASMEHVRVGRTAWFDALAARGYRLNLYESEFADFCSGAAFTSCTRYWSPSLSFIEHAPFAAGEKARLIGAKFAALSATVTQLATVYDVLVSRAPLRSLGLPFALFRERNLSSSVSALAAMDVLAADLRRAAPGNVYFAHILLPHYPYVAEPDCRLLPPSQWEFRRSPASHSAREAAYRRQLRCTLRKVGEVVDAFLASPGGRGGVVIVHGDHGSRITRIDPRPDTVGRFGDEDLVAGFSTLFAVRAPGIPPGLDSSPAATPKLLEALAGSGFRSTEAALSGGSRSEVILDDQAWQPRQRVPLPADWQPRAR